MQVKGSVVSLLTNRAIPVDQLDAAEAEALLEKSRAIIAKGDTEIAAKERDQERARRMLKLAHS